MTKRFGFTLAEVLITLGIIGVVAAMTIPTLMNQTGQAEFKTGFKKIVSTLNQAVTMNVALESSDFSVLGSGAGSSSIYNMFVSRMNVMSTAAAADTTLGFGANNYTLFFNDGMVVSFPNNAKDCTTGSHANCKMVVDVNGTKKPNMLSAASATNTGGRIADQFVLDFYEQQVLPHDEESRYVLYN